MLILVMCQNPATLRRLISEHRALHKSPLPPNYLFPLTTPSSTISGDLTQLVVLLVGPQGTAYGDGLWRLQLKMPDDYPMSPPKAVFKTRIWHPNVEETTGVVCVDTLKRDWKKDLTLRDVLVTISCLLIYPNPDSALNASAGQLLQEDYDTFARHAKLMTSIHAPVPRPLKVAASEARRRIDETGTSSKLNRERNKGKQREHIGSAIATESAPRDTSRADVEARRSRSPITRHVDPPQHQNRAEESDAEEPDEGAESKENDPSLSPSPVTPAMPSPRRNVLGKRPLSDLPTPTDPDVDDVDNKNDDDHEEENLSASERNIVNNHSDNQSRSSSSSSSNPNGARKSPKLSDRGAGINASGRILDEVATSSKSEACSTDTIITPFADADAEGTSTSISTSTQDSDLAPIDKPTTIFDEGKENITAPLAPKALHQQDVKKPSQPLGMMAPPLPLSSSILGSSEERRSASAPRRGSAASGGSSSGSMRAKNTKPRVGLRRL
ncbi:MAG: hypothetical protein M1833_003195 [Piccolia ochrophora]|nr:MAG: hypothetical protein M1833_003195 [Piccolia ochrophora]